MGEACVLDRLSGGAGGPHNKCWALIIVMTRENDEPGGRRGRNREIGERRGQGGGGHQGAALRARAPPNPVQ